MTDPDFLEMARAWLVRAQGQVDGAEQATASPTAAMLGKMFRG